ncbi:MAG: glycerol-3-phosphate 1-O-acyltransferase PlsY [Sulfurimicrobium sp.]|jgi:glycerol-3-phosphate acyltransferase PlsY|nr:glycerol-3-phosphate 1-O-acyltransferase PlsY [Sulfurimicrobium sp.]MDP2198631.1 glycerol-3-phosphate 1-O-acyltransferase PlsY [Sulfurimicrobium sp.]MDP2964380.1 glycerol-3-phosphate 1-O-acyltransferase PlsY [Sulfurimicrobium sp.]MDP3688293.1 glycerol-3-phosphate 1-O-acyltransferase PlsY [Sulfurimicrobium sp.]MDZ7656995.1 glycerol-3-phosphate 1-O-acyltransferase PlsY [Sulfurimicrobium sp.]
MPTIVFVLLAYLIGSLSFAVIVSKAFGLADPRSFGSKNPGATNVLRTGKKLAAGLTLLGDAAKGWLAVFLAFKLGADYGVGEAGIAAVALAVFVGHVYPVFFGFHGGKGVATALGILLALNVWMGLAVLATWLLATYMWRTSSLSALIAAGFAPFYGITILGANSYSLAVLLLSVLLVWRHKSNIQNLLSGQETRLGNKPQPGDAPPE